MLIRCSGYLMWRIVAPIQDRAAVLASARLGLLPIPAGRESSVNYERRCWTPQAAFMLVYEPYVEIRSWSDFFCTLPHPNNARLGS